MESLWVSSSLTSEYINSSTGKHYGDPPVWGKKLQSRWITEDLLNMSVDERTVARKATDNERFGFRDLFT